jgi:hypothetical protein
MIRHTTINLDIDLVEEAKRVLKTKRVTENRSPRTTRGSFRAKAGEPRAPAAGSDPTEPALYAAGAYPPP